MQCDKTLDGLLLALSPDHLSVVAQNEALAQAQFVVWSASQTAASTASNDSSVDASGTPQYWSGMSFYFLRKTPGTSNCTDQRALIYKNNCGYLDYVWVSRDSSGRTVIYHTIYGARSGNNKPVDDCIENVGPINLSGVKKGESDYGKYGSYQVGYHARGGRKAYVGFRQIDESHAPYSATWESFKPGQFDLHPWSVDCAPKKARSAFQIHGGVNSHSYWNRDGGYTYGCVRLTEGAVRAVWRRWNDAPNKNDLPLNVIYRSDTYG